MTPSWTDSVYHPKPMPEHNITYPIEDLQSLTSFSSRVNFQFDLAEILKVKWNVFQLTRQGRFLPAKRRISSPRRTSRLLPLRIQIWKIDETAIAMTRQMLNFKTDKIQRVHCISTIFQYIVTTYKTNGLFLNVTNAKKNTLQANRTNKILSQLDSTLEWHKSYMLFLYSHYIQYVTSSTLTVRKRTEGERNTASPKTDTARALARPRWTLFATCE